MAINLKGDKFLGKKIRKQRQKNGVTLSRAAKEMKFSPSFLSQIERGIVSPSISTLRNIADYLDTSISSLLSESLSKENYLIRRKKQKHPIIKGKGVKFHILTSSNSNLEFLYDEYEPNASTGDENYQHDGEECGFVLEGKLEVHLNKEKFILNEGDFIWFHSTIPYKILNLADKKSISIWVDSPPKF